MNGHRFELLSESNNPEQFNITFEALRIYVIDNFQRPEDMRSYFCNPMKKTYIELPADSPANPTQKEINKLRKEMRECEKRSKTLHQNEKALFQLIMRICSDKIKIRLRGRGSHFLEAAQRANCIWLLRNIRAIIPCLDPREDVFVGLHSARVAFYNCRQGSFQSLEDYLEVFKGHVETIEHYQGVIGESYVHIPPHNTNGDNLTIEQRKKAARDYSLAVGFMRGLDPQRNRSLLALLPHQSHPTNLKSAFDMVTNYEPGSL